jgi:serine/threonine protein phosphatase PrpC
MQNITPSSLNAVPGILPSIPGIREKAPEQPSALSSASAARLHSLFRQSISQAPRVLSTSPQFPCTPPPPAPAPPPVLLDPIETSPQPVSVRLSDIFQEPNRKGFGICEAIRKKEWRVVTDSEVERKLRKPILYTVIANPANTFGRASAFNRVFLERQHLQLEIEEEYSRELLILKHDHKVSSVEGRLDHLLRGIIPMEISGNPEALSFYAVLDGMNGTSCVNFVKNRLQQIFLDCFAVLPQPAASPSLERARIPETRSGYIWNALKLAIVKIQEAWVQFAKIHEREPGFFSNSSVSVCAVFFIDSEIWTLTIGNAKAICLDEKEQAIRYLSPNMSFSNRELSRSVEKRGGVVRTIKRERDHKRFYWIPSLGGILPFPRTIGAMNVPGVAARPKITKMVFQERAPYLIILAPDIFWETFSCPELLERFSQRVRQVDVSDGLSAVMAKLSLDVCQKKEGRPFSCFLIKSF